MDYEKAYKEARERAKAFLGKGFRGEDLLVECVFPELKESEDERIRKMLIEQMERWKKMSEEEGVEQDVNDATSAIAYLEQQKERGPLSKDEEYTLARIIEYLEDNDCPSEWKDLLHDVYSLPYRKKQRPANDRYMEGYAKGYKDAENNYNRGVSYHFDNPNIQKLDPNVVIESQTGGAYPIEKL